MDADNLLQNMNTRVVFKETRGMIRWLQLLFAIIAFSSVSNFDTSLKVGIICETPATNTTTTTTTTTPASASTTAAPTIAPTILTYEVKYPFDQKLATVTNPCNNNTFQSAGLSSSPQFFVATGVLAMLLSFAAILTYLLFTHTYTSIPMVPVADLISTGIICLFWFTASCAFASGVTLLKSTVSYDHLFQAICQTNVTCSLVSEPIWKGLNVALVTGFFSFVIWLYGIWTVFKETQFHQPKDQFPHQTLP